MRDSVTWRRTMAGEGGPGLRSWKSPCRKHPRRISTTMGWPMHTSRAKATRSSSGAARAGGTAPLPLALAHGRNAEVRRERLAELHVDMLVPRLMGEDDGRAGPAEAQDGAQEGLDQLRGVDAVGAHHQVEGAALHQARRRLALVPPVQGHHLGARAGAPRGQVGAHVGLQRRHDDGQVSEGHVRPQQRQGHARQATHARAQLDAALAAQLGAAELTRAAVLVLRTEGGAGGG